MAGDKKVRPGGLKVPAHPQLRERYRKANTWAQKESLIQRKSWGKKEAISATRTPCWQINA